MGDVAPAAPDMVVESYDRCGFTGHGLADAIIIGTDRTIRPNRSRFRNGGVAISMNFDTVDDLI